MHSCLPALRSILVCLEIGISFIEFRYFSIVLIDKIYLFTNFVFRICVLLIQLSFLLIVFVLLYIWQTLSRLRLMISFKQLN